ncbi:hypothetical protein [Helicobacter sp. UBA3407]|uniref:hypothetical protein n=1 Tax=Helicobacter TaxID=209 RepID=UPI0026254751|nr:hypothetical protein [Helicobacter sp. UBA3407]
MAKNTDIDFIFRPHPLLFAQLSKEDYWGETKIQVYFDKVCALNNVAYSTHRAMLDRVWEKMCRGALWNL